MNQIYIINLYYGKHKTEVETTKRDFYKWIDDLSKEFEVSKKWRTIEDDKRKVEVTEYYITNYYNDKDLIGTILKF